MSGNDHNKHVMHWLIDKLHSGQILRANTRHYRYHNGRIEYAYNPHEGWSHCHRDYPGLLELAHEAFQNLEHQNPNHPSIEENARQVEL